MKDFLGTLSSFDLKSDRRLFICPTSTVVLGCGSIYILIAPLANILLLPSEVGMFTVSELF